MNVMNATAASAGFIEAELLSQAWSLLIHARVELILFTAAIAAYFALFGNVMPRNPKLPPKKARIPNKEDDSQKDFPARDETEDFEDRGEAEKELQVAFEAGDHRSVLRCWNALKKFDKMPVVSLAHVVESMQRFKKDSPYIVQELKRFLKKYQNEFDMNSINDLFDSLSRRLDNDLMEKILETLESLNLKMDQRGYEIFLNMYFTMRSFQEVKTLVSQMKAKKVSFTTRATIIVIKTALKMNNFEEALQHFKDLKDIWTAHSVSSTPSMAPRHIVSQLVELACKEHQLAEFIPELHSVPINDEVVNMMLHECVRQKDMELTKMVETLAREQKIEFTDATYSLLIKGMSSDPVRVQILFDEVVEKGVEVTPDCATSVLTFCAQTGNSQIAEKLYAHMKPKQLPVLSAFIRFFAESEQCPSRQAHRDFSIDLSAKRPATIALIRDS